MPFDESLAKRIRDILREECPVKEKQMFGGLAFLVNGHMCCGIVGEDLVVRVGADAHSKAFLSRTRGLWISLVDPCEASCTLVLRVSGPSSNSGTGSNRN